VKAPYQVDFAEEHQDGAEKPSSPKLPLDSTKLRSIETREQCALFQSQRQIPEHISNGDEKLLPRWSGNFAKGFPHRQMSEVEPGRYETLLSALETGVSLLVD